MAAFTRKQYAGAAAPTTTTTYLASDGLTVDIASTNGWPSISGIPFYVVIQPASIYEEKCLATISGSTLTLIRAQDDTSASIHPSGSDIYPVFTANDADEANELVSKLTTAGDILTTDGTNLLRLGVGPNGYFLKASSSASAGIEWASIPTINSLDDIGDVTITSVADGQVLTYDSSASVWVNESLQFLTVSDNAPTVGVSEGDLWYNSNELELYTYYSGAWVQTTDSSPGVQEIYELIDVSIEDPVSGETLVYDGTNWVNDVVNPLSLNDVGDVSITSVVNGDFLRWNSSASVWINDAVNLSTDTVGDYVQSLVAGTGVVITNNTGEAATPTVAIGQPVSTSSSVTFAHVASNVTGDLTGNADTATSLETARTVELSGDVSGSASFDGTSNINIVTTVNTSSVALTELYGVNINSPEEFQNLEYNGTEWVNQYASVVTYVRNAEATELTTGTAVYLFGATGDHATVKRADNGSDTTSSKTVGLVGANIPASENGPVVTRGYVDGINLSGYSAGDVLWLGENGAFTKVKPSSPEHLVFIGVVVRATNNGIVYVATQNGYEIEELHNVKISSPQNYDFIRYNSASAMWVNEPINLGTDTVGDYVQNLTAGTGVTITNNSGEGASPTIAIGQDVGTSASVTFSTVTAGLVGNASTATTLQTSRAISLGGDLSGSVSFNGSSDVTLTATIQPNSVALGTDTSGDYVASLVAGTGITLTNNSGEGATPTMSVVVDNDQIILATQIFG